MEKSKTEDEIELYVLADEKVESGKKLILQLDELKHIDGATKIKRKVASEVASLEKVIANNQLKVAHILCSNLVHFSYLVNILKQTENVLGVDYPIKTGGSNKSTTRIDIVAENGSKWIKVIARNPKALKDIAFGNSNYGTKSIFDHAVNYTEGAKDNQYCFQNPKIIFDFANQIDDELESSLSELNIEVRINGQSKEAIDASADPSNKITTLNLDVTTMMAFVSSLTCESCNFAFDQPILTQQAERESICPTKKYLDKLFQDKELIACQSAVDSFLSILNVVGGPNEKARSDKFLPTINVYPDLTEEEENALWSMKQLRIGGKINERTHKIISFGMYRKALTVTANKGAIEGAKMQGINIPSVIHEARALTEQKQLTAKHVKRI